MPGRAGRSAWGEISPSRPPFWGGLAILAISWGEAGATAFGSLDPRYPSRRRNAVMIDPACSPRSPDGLLSGVVAPGGTRVMPADTSKHTHPNGKATGRGESARGSADFSPHRALNAFWYKKMRTEVRAPKLPPADGAQRNNLFRARCGRNVRDDLE